MGNDVDLYVMRGEERAVLVRLLAALDDERNPRPASPEDEVFAIQTDSSVCYEAQELIEQAWDRWSEALEMWAETPGPYDALIQDAGRGVVRVDAETAPLLLDLETFYVAAPGEMPVVVADVLSVAERVLRAA